MFLKPSRSIESSTHGGPPTGLVLQHAQQFAPVGQAGQRVGVRHRPEVRLALGQPLGDPADRAPGEHLLAGEEPADEHGEHDADRVEVVADDHADRS